MQEQNESNADASLELEKLMQEWNILQRQSTMVKPIQLARSLKMKSRTLINNNYDCQKIYL